MSRRPARPRYDPRFALHQRQPRADKLDARQRRLCSADPAFSEALQARVASRNRFCAFLAGAAYYVDLEQPCAKCGSRKKRTRDRSCYGCHLAPAKCGSRKKRTRDRSCYGCHLARSGINFERMKAGLVPEVARNRDSLADLQKRERAERAGEYEEKTFDGLIAKCWPTGRLEITFPDGYREPDMSKLDYQGMKRAIIDFPQLALALTWAGWIVPG